MYIYIYIYLFTHILHIHRQVRRLPPQGEAAERPGRQLPADDRQPGVYSVLVVKA